VRKHSPTWRDWLHTLVVAGGLFLFTETFLLQGFSVHGSCMEPNLYTGERLLGNKLRYRLHPPQRGDVVVFRYPDNPRKIYVKRVVALPGEMIAIRDGTVYLNGKPLHESYVVNPAHGSYPPTRVPQGQYFMLGDNRDHSSDSRTWGFVPARHLEGKVWLRYWPLRRAGLLPAGRSSPSYGEQS
jgi:signal peptidase I